MLKIKNNFRFLHCILAYLVSFYSTSRGGSFGVHPIRIRPLTCVLRTLCIILYKVWHTLDHTGASLNTSGCILSTISGYPLIMLAYSAQAYPRFMSCQLLLQMMFSRFTVRQRMLHVYQGLNGVLLQRAAYSKPSAALSRKRNAVNIAITGDGKKLRALWDSESSVMPSTYHSVWLRHNCQCPQCLSSYNQTVLLSYELDPKVAISEAHVSGRLLLYCVYA